MLAQAVEARDYRKMQSKVQSLKESCGYIGASYLHFTCFHILEQWIAGNHSGMLDFYPLLVECAIDFKIESRKVLATHNGKCLTPFSRSL